jgi:hypothetical protein
MAFFVVTAVKTSNLTESRNLVVLRGFHCLTHCVCSPQGQTEWQVYLRQCIEIVAKVAELAPVETYSLVVSHLILAIGFSNHGCRPRKLTEVYRNCGVSELMCSEEWCLLICYAMWLL